MQESKGSKCICFFFPELASLMPREMMNRMRSIVALHFSRDKMYMRQSVVRMIGQILIHLKPRGNETPRVFSKLRKTMIALLTERCLDRIAIVRKLVVQALISLLEKGKLSEVEMEENKVLDHIIDRINDRNA